MNYVGYVRIYIRGRHDIKEAKKELDKILKEIDYEVDGLYDMSIMFADS